MPELPINARVSWHALRLAVLRRAHELGYLVLLDTQTLVPPTPHGRVRHAYLVEVPAWDAVLRLLGDEALGVAVAAAGAVAGRDGIARLAWREDFTKPATRVRRRRG